ncbi:hypothetical protein EV182_002232, partial [Spiromyces aspiralis]
MRANVPEASYSQQRGPPLVLGAGGAPAADTKARSTIDKSVEKLTKSGEPNLDKRMLKASIMWLLLPSLKRTCKGSDANVEYAYKAIMSQLRSGHSQIRYNALMIADQLFMRSHRFRQCLCNELSSFLKLTLGLYQAELPLPKLFIPLLKELAAQCIKRWHDKFGIGYNQLRLTYKHLRWNVRLDFNTGQILPTEHELKRRRIQKKKREDVRRRRIRLVHDEFCAVRQAAHICLDEMNADFRVLVPSIDDLFADLRSDNGGSDPSEDEFEDADDPEGAGGGGEHDGDLNEDSDEEIDRILAVMAANRHRIEIDLNPETLYELEGDGERDTISARARLAGNLAKVKYRYMPTSEEWLAALARIGGQDLEEHKRLAESIERLRTAFIDSIEKCKELEIEAGPPNTEEKPREEPPKEEVGVRDRATKTNSLQSPRPTEEHDPTE